MTVDDQVKAMQHPLGATLETLLTVARDMNAGTMKLSGEDGNGKPVFAVLIAVGDEAARLLPEMERLTADDDEADDEGRETRHG